MRLKMKILIVMGSLMLIVFALNLGVASAHDMQDSDVFAPVGRNISDQGNDNGFGNPNSNAVVGIGHNPLCPVHYGPLGTHPPGNP